MNEEIKKAIEAAKEIKRKCDEAGDDWTCLAGKKALEIEPDFFKKYTSDMNTVIVTGTNGKTTTTRMISEMLRAEGIENICNRVGANMQSGIATVLCLNTDENGEAIIRTAVLESDEFDNIRCMPPLHPKVFVITNLSEDHLSEHVAEKFVAKSLIKAITDSGPELCCMDKGCHFSNLSEDQLSEYVAEKLVAKLLIKAMTDSVPGVCCIDEECQFLDDLTSVEGWKYSFFSAEEDAAIVDGERFPLTLSIPGKYNMRNAAAAIAAVKAMGELHEAGIKALETLAPVFGRFEHITEQGMDITLLLAKNPVSWKVSIDYLSELTGEMIPELYLVADIEGGISCWFADDYAPLFEVFKTIYVSGDFGIRLREHIHATYEDKKDRVFYIKSEQIVPQILREKKRCYIVNSYNAMLHMRDRLISAGLAKPMWEL